MEHNFFFGIFLLTKFFRVGVERVERLERVEQVERLEHVPLMFRSLLDFWFFLDWHFSVNPNGTRLEHEWNMCF